MLRMIGKVVKYSARIIIDAHVIYSVGFKLANHAHIAAVYLALKFKLSGWIHKKRRMPISK